MMRSSEKWARRGAVRGVRAGFYVLLMLSVFFMARPAYSDPAEPLLDPAELLSARLFSAGQDAQGRRLAVLELKLSPGWKTYWRAAGETGSPPMFNWARSTNAGGLELKWPAPKHFEDYGMSSFGYKGEVSFPIQAQPIDPAQPLRLELAAMVPVCAEVCVPMEVKLSAELPPSAAPPSEAFEKALRTTPRPAHSNEVSRCAYDAKERAFTAQLRREGPFEKPIAILENDGHAVLATLSKQQEALNLRGAVAAPPHVTVIDGEWAVETRHCP